MEDNLKTRIKKGIMNLKFQKYEENSGKQNLYKLMNEYDNGFTVGEEWKNIIWYEPEEFYSEFEKFVNDISESEDDKEEILEYLKGNILFWEIPEYVVTDKCYSRISKENYKANIQILKRLYYIRLYAKHAQDIEKAEQMKLIGDELELLIRKDLQRSKKSLNEHMQKVLEELK